MTILGLKQKTPKMQMRFFKSPVYRRPNVMPLSLAALFNDTGSDMLFAFYPLFVITILGVQDMKIFGLIDSVALLFGLLIRPLSGWIADRKGKKHFIWSGYTLLAASRFIQGLAQIWYHLVPPKILYELGRGVRNPPREALLAESVPENERGFAFGLLNSMDTVGAVIGPLVGIGLFSLFLNLKLALSTSYRLIFFCAALPTIVSICIIITKARDLAGSPKHNPTPKLSVKGRHPLVANKTLLAFTIISALFSFWAVTENFMLVCGAKILKISREQIWMVVILYWFINVTFAPSALITGRLSDKHGRKPLIQIAFLLLAVLTTGFAFVKGFWQVGLLFALHGMYQGFLKPSQTALVADLSPPERRGHILGSYSMLVGMAAIPGPLIFGLLWDAYNWQVPFVVSGLFITFCFVLLTFVVRVQKDFA